MVKHALATFFLLAGSAHAQTFDAQINEGGQLVIYSSGGDITSVEIRSAGGYLVPVNPAELVIFPLALENSKSQIFLSSIPDGSIEGAVVTDTTYEPPSQTPFGEPIGDLTLRLHNASSNQVTVCQGRFCNIPEPSSFPLLLLGGILVGLNGRKSRV